MNSALLLRSSGLAAVTVALFIGCGGRIEADYASDAGSDAASSKCGNGRIDTGEDCDGTHLGGATCSSATMNSRPTGQLSCSKQCKLDTDGCTGSGGPGTGGGTGTGGRSGTGGGVGIGGTGTGGGVGTGGAIGAGGRAGGATTACTSTSDCSGRQVCCGTRANTAYTFACAATCARTDTTAECHVASECGNREVCCGTTNQTGTSYSSIACAATCTGNGERPLCATDNDCAAGTTCQTSRVLPSTFKVCR